MEIIRNITNEIKYEKTILNRKEASDYLGVSIRHLDNLMSKRMIPFSRLGRRIIFRKIDIDKFVESTNTHRGLAI